MILHADAAAGVLHTERMDGISNLPELIADFVTRQDYIAFYLGFVGFWCLWLGYRGLFLRSTPGFGWRAPTAMEAAALSTGRAWLAIGAGSLAAGAGLWFTA